MFEPLANDRREFLAKSVMDLVKITIAAAFASGFFLTLPVAARFALGMVIVVLFLLSWF